MRRARPLLGTIVEIRIDAGGDAGAMAAAFEAVQEVHRLMSAHEETSDVARINRTGADARLAVAPWTWTVLRRAHEIHAATQGLFECCVAPALKASGLLPRLPGDSVADPHAGCRDLELLPGNVVRLRRPLQVTLDGIAKGFAVDRAVDALRAHGVAAGAVNAGGDLRVFGPTPQPVHVRDPREPARLLRVGAFRDAAIATSAPYYAPRAALYVDPRTGEACRSCASATVIAPDCMTADALTKPLLLDPARGQRAARRLGARAIVLPLEEAAA